MRTFGTTGAGKAVDSPAIKRAIEAAAAGSGGAVIFAAGNYVSFSIRLKSHVDLYLSANYEPTDNQTHFRQFRKTAPNLSHIH